MSPRSSLAADPAPVGAMDSALDVAAASVATPLADLDKHVVSYEMKIQQGFRVVSAIINRRVLTHFPISQSRLTPCHLQDKPLHCCTNTWLADSLVVLGNAQVLTHSEIVALDERRAVLFDKLGRMLGRIELGRWRCDDGRQSREAREDGSSKAELHLEGGWKKQS